MHTLSNPSRAAKAGTPAALCLVMASAHAGDVYKLYDKWFRNPVPPKGLNLNMPVGHLSRDTFRFPTDKVGV